jgi:polyisoprenoid-binding protein YceI
MSTTGFHADPLPAGSWEIEQSTAHVGFTGRVSRFAPTFSARFRDVSGSIDIGTDPAGVATVEVSVLIALASMTSGNRSWDELIALANPFDLARQPVGSFRGLSVIPAGAGLDEVAIDGTLALRGRRQSVSLRARVQPSGGGQLAISAAGTVDREAFGLRLDVPGLTRLLPKRMDLRIDVTAQRPLAGRP